MLMYCTAGAGKLCIRLAEEFNDNTKRAITNQEKTGHCPHRTRLANVQVQNDKQYNPFQRHLIKLRCVTRQRAVGIKNRLPLWVGLQQ